MGVLELTTEFAQELGLLVGPLRDMRELTILASLPFVPHTHLTTAGSSLIAVSPRLLPGRRLEDITVNSSSFRLESVFLWSALSDQKLASTPAT
jgi:hypothetical protein